MALYNKTDMIYKNYYWTAYGNDDPKIKGEPDATFFSRNEGFEVLYLINKLAEAWDFKQKSSGEKMEKMIHDHLPSNIRSQENVKKWISDNWKTY